MLAQRLTPRRSSFSFKVSMGMVFVSLDGRKFGENKKQTDWGMLWALVGMQTIRDNHNEVIRCSLSAISTS
jgi:hypothetical protein